MDALQWMGAIRMRAQTADKNITIIHTTSVHQLTSCDVKSCMFVRNKSIIKMFLTSKCCLRINTCLVSSESEEKYAQIKHRLKVKTVQNSSKQVCWWYLMWGQLEMEFFTGGNVIIDRSILARSKGLKLQCLNNGFVSYKLNSCGLLVNYCEVFISCLDSHSDGTHSLQRIHWWASDIMQHFSKSDKETNSFTSLMNWGWVNFTFLGELSLQTHTYKSIFFSFGLFARF